MPRVSIGLLGTVPFATAIRFQTGLLAHWVPNGAVLVETGEPVLNGSGHEVNEARRK